MTPAPSISSALVERTLRAVFCNRFDRLDSGDLLHAGGWLALTDDPIKEGFDKESALTAIRAELAKRVHGECAK